MKAQDAALAGGAAAMSGVPDVGQASKAFVAELGDGGGGPLASEGAGSALLSVSL